MNQIDLALKADVSLSLIQKLEAGHPVSLKNLARVTGAIGGNVDEFPGLLRMVGDDSRSGSRVPPSDPLAFVKIRNREEADQRALTANAPAPPARVGGEAKFQGAGNVNDPEAREKSRQFRNAPDPKGEPTFKPYAVGGFVKIAETISEPELAAEAIADAEKAIERLKVVAKKPPGGSPGRKGKR